MELPTLSGRPGRTDIGLAKATTMRQRALQGKLSNDFVGKGSGDSWMTPSNKLVVFVSSTFTDTGRERNLLLETILPDLRTKGHRDGIEVVFVDMRWGVRDENTLDHQTWIACRREIERCWRESGGLFFLSLQGDKYGYRPLPRDLGKSELEATLARHSEDVTVAEIARKWYALDENSIGGRPFVLRNLADVNDGCPSWKSLVEELFRLTGGIINDDFDVDALTSSSNSVLRDFWRARLPQEIRPKCTFEAICAQCSDGGKLARIWYTEKDDGVKLAHPADILHNDFWRNDMAKLRESLLVGVEFGEGADIVIGQSVTEWEVRFALSLPGGAARSHWLHRTFEGGAVVGQSDLADGSDRLPALKDFMRVKLADEDAGKFEEAVVKVSSFHDRDAEWEGYMSKFEARARKLFESELDEIKTVAREWATDGRGIGLAGDELAEVLHHVRWAGDKAMDFEGRVDELVKAMKFVASPNRRVQSQSCLSNLLLFYGALYLPKYDGLEGVCLAVVGKSGAGKTAFMAKLAFELFAKRPHIPVLVRFCGTSRGSTTGLTLVQSLCRQLEFIFRQENYGSVLSCFRGAETRSYKDWVTRLHALLASNAVVLVIDSLDQLSNDNEARSGLTFLRGLRPHAQTKIIVSCLPDETDALTGKRYFYGCSTLLRKEGVPEIEIKPFDANGAVEMVRQLLKRIGRTLTEEQWRVLGNQSQATALYCRLAVRVASTWSSFTPFNQCVLPPSVPELIDLIFDSSEKEFGREWTRVALACLTFSRGGLSDGEMQDILSMNDERVLDHVFQYSKPENVMRFPMHVWLRLKGALQGLLVEREGSCAMWYHRQLKETGEARYAGLKELAHELMGKYFGDLCGELGEKRKIARQPLSFSDKRVWSDSARINTRRCIEAPHHLVAAGVALSDEARRELCSVELVSACAKSGQIFELLKALMILERSGAGGERVNHYMRWLLNDAGAMHANPQTMVAFTCLAHQPLCSLARQDLEKAAAAQQLGDVFSRAFDKCERTSFNAGLITLEGHSGKVSCVAFSPDGRLIVSGSDDTTVRVWDAEFGACVLKLEGHSVNVSCVAFSPDGYRIVSGSSFNVRLWDVDSGACTKNITGIYLSDVTSVAFSPCGQRIVVGAEHNPLLPQGSVRMFDSKTGTFLALSRIAESSSLSVAFSPDGVRVVSGELHNLNVLDAESCSCLLSLKGHSDIVTSVAFSPDGGCIASGSQDKNVRVWNSNSGTCLSKLEGHLNKVTSVAFSLDGLIVSGSADKSVCIWNPKSSACLAKLCGHSDTVTSVAFSPNGRRIVSGSNDNTVRVWAACLSNKDSSSTFDFSQSFDARPSLGLGHGPLSESVSNPLRASRGML